MKTLADKMEAINVLAIVQLFKLNDIFTKGKVGFFEACNRNRTLVDSPDAKNESAEVFVILLGEDTVEDTRAKAIDV